MEYSARHVCEQDYEHLTNHTCYEIRPLARMGAEDPT
jgi:hypothetical protein